MRALVVVAVLLVAPNAAAARIAMEARVNAADLKVGDRFQLDVVVTVAGNGEPDDVVMPDMGSFTVVRDGKTQRSSVQIAGGRRSVSVETRYTFILAADAPGVKTIGPGRARLGGEEARTDPITIRVLPDVDRRPTRRANEKLEPYFLELSFDRDEVFVGEQATLSARVYATGPVDLRPLTMPKLPQFWVEVLEQGGGRPSERSIGGQHYYVYALHQAALFPLEPGEHTVEPLDVQATVGGGLWSRGRSFVLTSKPQTILVKPLPAEGRPADFDPGNVGRFELKARVEPRRTRVGQPVTYELLVEGVGNGGQARLPAMPERIEGARVFPPTFDEKSSVKDGRIAVQKRGSMLVQPLREGRLTIPGTRFVFFDPATASYEVREVAPLTVVVDDAAPVDDTGGVGGGRQRIAKGARPVRTGITVDGVLAPYRRAWFAPGVLALLLGASALAALGGVRATRRRSTDYAARLRARERRASLDEAQASRDLARARVVVEDVLAERFGDEIRARPAHEVKAMLTARGFAPSDADRVEAFLGSVEAVLYAPPSGLDRRALFDEARAVLTLLEGAP